MKKLIRNNGYVHPLKSEEDRQYVTSVDFAARTYTFPAGKDTPVEADVADYVSSIYAGQGLVIVDHGKEMRYHLQTSLAAARAALPPPEPGPAIPEVALRRGGVEKPKPLAGTEAIRLARDAAAREAAEAAAVSVPSKIKVALKNKLAAARAALKKEK